MISRTVIYYPFKSHMNYQTTPHKVTSLYFGEKHLETLNEWTRLAKKLRRSRTAALDFLITYYKTTEENKKTAIHF